MSEAESPIESTSADHLNRYHPDGVRCDECLRLLTVELCEHHEWEGDEGPVEALGRMPVRWKCRACGAIKHDAPLPPEVVALVREARAMDYGPLRETVETVKAMLEIDPMNNSLLRILADVHIERSETVEAIAALERAVENNPSDVEAVIALTSLYRETGQHEAADRLTFAARNIRDIPLASRIAMASELYARSASDRGAAEQAEEILNEIINQDGDVSEALFMLGGLRYRESRFGEAGDLLMRALAVDPRHPDEWARAASAFDQAGDRLRARDIAEEGLMLFPGQFPLLRIAAEASLAVGDYEGAIRFTSEAIEVLDENSSTDALRARMLEYLGDAYGGMGDQEKALRNWRKAYDLDPNRDSLRSKLEPNP